MEEIGTGAARQECNGFFEVVYACVDSWSCTARSAEGLMFYVVHLLKPLRSKSVNGYAKSKHDLAQSHVQQAEEKAKTIMQEASQYQEKIDMANREAEIIKSKAKVRADGIIQDAKQDAALQANSIVLMAQVKSEQIISSATVVATVTLTNSDGETLEITGTLEHPFYVVDKGFVGLSDLQEWDVCVAPDGGEFTVVGVVESDELQTVYNFEVEDAHTYYVGLGVDDAVLVHNQCQPDSVPWAATRGLGQGILNSANGAQDIGIGLANLLTIPYNATSWFVNKLGGANPYVWISSPDWSRGLLTDEAGDPGTWGDTHGWSKFTGGSSAFVFGSFGAARIAEWGNGTPKMNFPGMNPAKGPPGFEWRGKQGSAPGSTAGNWYNPKTGESLHPDMSHGDPIGPHWDYRDSFGQWWRLFPDGSKEIKP